MVTLTDGRRVLVRHSPTTRYAGVVLDLAGLEPPAQWATGPSTSVVVQR